MKKSLLSVVMLALCSLAMSQEVIFYLFSLEIPSHIIEEHPSNPVVKEYCYVELLSVGDQNVNKLFPHRHSPDKHRVPVDEAVRVDASVLRSSPSLKMRTWNWNKHCLYGAPPDEYNEATLDISEAISHLIFSQQGLTPIQVQHIPAIEVYIRYYRGTLPENGYFTVSARYENSFVFNGHKKIPPVWLHTNTDDAEKKA